MPKPQFSPPRLHLIAEGSSARVYESRDRRGEPAALKLSRGPETDPLLEREGEFSQRWRHDALLRVIESGRDAQGRRWLLLPLLPGDTLETWRSEDSKLVEALTLVADALDYLHERGYGHADLKPANLLLAHAPKESLLLGDLGLASPLGAPAPGGTPAYLSPNRLAAGDFCWTDDLQSLVVLVYEALAGRLPWESTHGDGLLKSIRSRRILPLSQSRPDLPGELDTFFREAISGETGYARCMGWMDGLRERFGLQRADRSLFLRDAGSVAPELFPHREALSLWLREQLWSCTVNQLPTNDRVLRLLEDLSGRSRHELERILRFLVERRLLIDVDGLASFSIPGPEIRELWRSEGIPALSNLSEQERKLLIAGALAGPKFPETRLSAWLGIDDIATRARRLQDIGLLRRNAEGGIFVPGEPLDVDTPLPAMDPEDLDALWRGEADLTNRGLRLIELGLRTGASEWIGTLAQSQLQVIARNAADDAGDRLRQVLEVFGPSSAVEILLGLHEVYRMIRAADLPSAVRLFWEVEPELELEISGELSRVVVYQLADSGLLHEANDFLIRWRKEREAEYRGTVLEIQVAAREVTILGKYGEYEAARALVGRYQSEMAGRPGLWILYMAQANIASALRQSKETVYYARLALAGLEKEGGAPKMRLDLLFFLANRIDSWGDPVEIQDLNVIIEEAKQLADVIDETVLKQRVLSTQAGILVNRGEIRSAEHLYRQAIEAAQRTGELKRAPYLISNHQHVLSSLGDYRRLRTERPNLTLLLAETDQPKEIESIKRAMALSAFIFGDLKSAHEFLSECSGIAVQLGMESALGNIELLHAVIVLYLKSRKAAVPIIESSISRFEKLNTLRRLHTAKLHLVDIRPDPLNDGERLASVIEYAMEVGNPGYLPLAWCLECRRLRLLGDCDNAALALEQAFLATEKVENVDEHWPIHQEAAELALAAGEMEAARAELRRAMEINRDLSLHFPEGMERERFLARPDRAAVLARLREISAQ